MRRIGKGESLWGKCTKPRVARLTPAGLCQGFAGRSSPSGTLRALLIPTASAPGGAARSACPAHVTAARTRAARPGGACKRPVWTRHGFAVAREGLRSPSARLPASGGPRRGAGSAFPWPTAFHFALQSRPSLLSRSPAAGLDRRRCATPARRHASGQAVTISSPLRGCGIRPGLAFGFPAVMSPCSSPKPRRRPSGRSLRGDS